MTIPGLNEGLIRQRATPASIHRGQEYYRHEAVLSLVQGDDTLESQVRGSGQEPYRVRITFNQKGITHAECTCPCNLGGWCKHIVATLVTCLSPPEKPRHPRGLDRQQQEEFESIRLQVIDILHSLDWMRRSQAYWHVEQVVNQVRHLLHEVKILLMDGERERALVALEAITEGYIADWTCLDDSDGFAGAFFGDLDRVWSQALSMANLTLAERRKWRRKLKRWQNEISPYGIVDVFRGQ